MTPKSDSRTHLYRTLNISEIVQGRDIVTTDYATNRMTSFPMTLSNPSRSKHSSTSNNSKTTQDRAIRTMED